MTNIFSVDKNAFEIYWRNKPALVERFACEYVGSKNVASFAAVDVTSGKNRLLIDLQAITRGLATPWPF